MSNCLGASQTGRRLLHNADKSLRIGRWLRLPASITGYAEQVNPFGAQGVYSSASIFQASRMNAALNAAVGKMFSSVSGGGYAPYLGYAWEQDWDPSEWEDNAWIVPPNFRYGDYYMAAACRYSYYNELAPMEGEAVAGIMLKVNGTGHGTGQSLTAAYVTPNGGEGWVGVNHSPARVGPLNSGVVFDFYLTNVPAFSLNANFATPDATIDCNTGNAVCMAGGVQFLYDWPGAWFDDTGYKGVIELKLDAQRIKDLMSSPYITLVVRPRLLSNFSITGQINYWGGTLNPNTQSFFNYVNNRTSEYTQMAQSCFFWPELYVYAH